MQIKSRPYQASDLESCLEIFKTNIGLYFAKEEVVDFEKFLAQEVSDNNYSIFFAEDKPERLLACGGFGWLENKLFLRWGMVDQRRHKRGVGSQLLLHRLTAAQKKYGDSEVLIDTSQHVQGFYEKYGFKSISVIKDGFAPNIDKVRMCFSDWDQNFLKAV